MDFFASVLQFFRDNPGVAVALGGALALVIRRFADSQGILNSQASKADELQETQDNAFVLLAGIIKSQNETQVTILGELKTALETIAASKLRAEGLHQQTIESLTARAVEHDRQHEVMLAIQKESEKYQAHMRGQVAELPVGIASLVIPGIADAWRQDMQVITLSLDTLRDGIERLEQRVDANSIDQATVEEWRDKLGELQPTITWLQKWIEEKQAETL